VRCARFPTLWFRLSRSAFFYSAMPTFILYSRSYCHLCDDMLAALERLRPEYDFTVSVIDIDTEAPPALLERYDELVPVLLAGNSNSPLCHYFLDEPAVRRWLDAQKA
jgi:thiol-disulfide isomerase/thioredoxin